MAIRQYIGARYVPRFLGTYDPTQQYDALDVVDNGTGTSYIGIKTVPPGTPLSDRNFWFIYGAASGTDVHLQNQIDDINNEIGDFTDLDPSFADLVTAINNANNSIIQGFKNIKDFGAVGDSVTDNTQAFKDAFTYMQTNKVGLFIPKGDYRIMAPIEIDDSLPKFCVIRGEDIYYTVIRADIGTNETLFDISSSGDFRYADIGNFSIVNSNYASIYCWGISTSRLTHSRIHDIVFRGFVTGYKATLSWDNILENLQFFDRSSIANQASLILDYQCNNTHIRNCMFHQIDGNTSNSGININRAQSNIKIENCDFSHGRGIVLTTLASDTALLNNISIDNCYFEGMDGLCVLSATSNYNEIANVSVRDCYLYTKNTVAAALNLNFINGQIVTGNFANGPSTEILVGNAMPPHGEYLFAGNFDLNAKPFTTGSCHEVSGSGATSPSGTHHVGEVYYNSAPTAGNVGWVCTVAGTPGTWVAFG